MHSLKNNQIGLSISGRESCSEGDAENDGELSIRLRWVSLKQAVSQFFSTAYWEIRSYWLRNMVIIPRTHNNRTEYSSATRVSLNFCHCPSHMRCGISIFLDFQWSLGDQISGFQIQDVALKVHRETSAHTWKKPSRKRLTINSATCRLFLPTLATWQCLTCDKMLTYHA